MKKKNNEKRSEQSKRNRRKRGGITFFFKNFVVFFVCLEVFPYFSLPFYCSVDFLNFYFFFIFRPFVFLSFFSLSANYGRPRGVTNGRHFLDIFFLSFYPVLSSFFFVFIESFRNVLFYRVLERPMGCCRVRGGSPQGVFPGTNERNPVKTQ